jgi:hypothetical protein
VGRRKVIAAARRVVAAPKPAIAVPMVRRPKPGDPKPGDPKLVGPKAGVLRGVNRKAGALKDADPKIGLAPIAALMATTADRRDVLDRMIVDLRDAVLRAVDPKVADLVPLPAGRPKVLAAARKVAIAPTQKRIPRPT